MKEFLQHNFDKLLLFALLLVLLSFVLHMLHANVDPSTLAWGRELVGTVIGALLGLITGLSIRSAAPGVTSTNTQISESHRDI